MDKETIGEKYPYNFVSLGDKVLNRGERVIGEKTGILKCKLITYSRNSKVRVLVFCLLHYFNYPPDL